LRLFAGRRRPPLVSNRGAAAALLSS